MTSDDPQLSFGRWLRRQRKAFDLTQVELAARVPLFAAEQALYNQTATAVGALLDPQSCERQLLAGRAMSLAAIARFVGALAGDPEALP